MRQSQAPRIIFHHLRGLTVLQIAQWCRLSETYVWRCIDLWRAEGGCL